MIRKCDTVCIKLNIIENIRGFFDHFTIYSIFQYVQLTQQEFVYKCNGTFMNIISPVSPEIISTCDTKTLSQTNVQICID